jgi:IS1 family transposase
MTTPLPIPTSTSVLESAVIRAPPSLVWHHIKLGEFQKFWSALSKSEPVKGNTDDTDVYKWTFKDGTVLEVKQEEHSVRSAIAPAAQRPDHAFAR